MDIPCTTQVLITEATAATTTITTTITVVTRVEIAETISATGMMSHIVERSREVFLHTGAVILEEILEVVLEETQEIVEEVVSVSGRARKTSTILLLTITTEGKTEGTVGQMVEGTVEDNSGRDRIDLAVAIVDKMSMTNMTIVDATNR